MLILHTVQTIQILSTLNQIYLSDNEPGLPTQLMNCVIAIMNIRNFVPTLYTPMQQLHLLSSARTKLDRLYPCSQAYSIRLAYGWS